MASIAFNPSNNNSSAIQSADFENGFNVTQNQNVFNFNGSWYCPVNPAPATYTQNIICVCLATGNCAVIAATFSFNGTTGTITGSMTVSTTSTQFGNSGIASMVGSGSAISIFPSGSTEANTYLSAPFLLGHLGETSF